MASEGGGGVESLLVVRRPPGTGGGGSGETDSPLRADRAGEAGAAETLLVPGGGGGGGGGSGETDSPMRAYRAGEAAGGAERLEAAGEEDRREAAEEAERQAGLEEQQAGLEGELRLEALRQKLQVWLRPYGGLLMALQRLLVWERPLYSLTVALTLNTLFWLVSSMSLRPLFLISLCLLGLMLLERWKHKLFLISAQPAEPEPSQVQRDPTHPPALLSVPDLSLHLADSYLTCCAFLQEALQYKRQHHGKFCLMVFSGCAVLAVVGHYVPGIMISYIMALSVLLWPLVVYHELIQRMYTGLEPILMKLDYSMKGGAAGRRHDKRIIALLREVKKELESSGDEPRAETESDSEEEELTSFAPTVDAKLTALAMAITDSELSDEEASILESGGFSVSRATTPNLSEDLDVQSVHSEPDESCLTSDLLTSDLTEFHPSVQEVPSVEHSLLHVPPRGPQGPPQVQGPHQGPLQASDGERPLSLLQQLASPLHFVNTHFNGHAAGGDVGLGGGATAATAALLLGAVGVQEEEEGERLVASSPPPDDVPQHHRSLEALSEQIVSTAISAVVQNTLSALPRSGSQDHLPLLPSGSQDHLPLLPSGSQDHLPLLPSGSQDHLPLLPSGSQDHPPPLPSASEDQPTVETLSSLEHSLPAETTTPEETFAAEDLPEPVVVSSSLDHFLPGETTETLRPGSKDPFLPSETVHDERETSVAGTPAAEDDGAATTFTETPGGDEPEQAVVAAEEEDFELLDQSELDEEGGRGLVGSVVGGTTSGATDTSPSLPLHQPEESS